MAAIGVGVGAASACEAIRSGPERAPSAYRSVLRDSRGARSTPPTARRPHAAAPPGRHCSAARRRAGRRLVLAARPRRPRGARVPRGRERVHRRARSPTSSRCASELFEEIRGRVQETDASAPVPHGDRTSTSPAPSKGRSTTCTAGARRDAGLPDPSRRRARRRREVAARRERARGRPRLLRGRRSRGQPRPAPRSPTPIDTPAASATSCASATSTTGDDLADVVARRLLRRGLGQRRPHRSSTPGPTTPCGRGRCGATGSARRPPTTCSCSRRTTTASTSSVGRTRSGRFVVIDVGVEGHERGVARRRRRRPAAAARSSSRASRVTSTTSSTTRRPRRRPLLRAHQRRRRRELRAHGRTGRRPGRATLDRPSSRTAPTCASTTSTRSPATSCCRERADGARAAPGPQLDAAATSSTTTWSRCPRRCTRLWVGANPEYDARDAALRVHVAGHADRRRTTTTSTPAHADAREAPAGPGVRPRRSTRRARLWATAADGTRVPISIVHRRDLRADGTRSPMLLTATARTRSRSTRRFSASRGEPARPRRGVRDRARPRRRRARAPVVRGRQARCTRRTRSPTSSPAPSTSSPRATRARPARRARRQRRRAADGRGREPAARPVPRHRRRGAVRRLPHDDPRRDAPAHRSPSGRSGATPSHDPERVRRT